MRRAQTHTLYMRSQVFDQSYIYFCRFFFIQSIDRKRKITKTTRGSNIQWFLMAISEEEIHLFDKNNFIWLLTNQPTNQPTDYLTIQSNKQSTIKMKIK